jgi:hypothetical protein
LEIMRQKVTKKKLVEHIKEAKRKEWNDKQRVELLNVVKQEAKKHVENKAKIIF